MLGFREANEEEKEDRDGHGGADQGSQAGIAQAFHEQAEEKGDAEGADAEKDPEQAEAGAALLLVDIGDQGIGSAVDDPAAETDEEHRPAQQIEPGRPADHEQTGEDKGRADDEQDLVAVAVDDRAEEERTQEHADGHEGEERPGHGLVEAELFDDRGEEGAEDGHDDAEDEHRHAGGGKDGFTVIRHGVSCG